MTTSICSIPYELVCSITSCLPIKDALRLNQCCWRLASFQDYNHDPRRDNQAGILKAQRAELWDIFKRLLLIKHVDVTMCFQLATYNGQAEVVKLCIFSSVAPPPSAVVQDAFKLAINLGHQQVVKVLVNSGLVDPSMQDNFAIKVAARNGNASIVEILMSDERVNPVAGQVDALDFAAMFNHPNVVDVLLNDARYNGESIAKALHVAAIDGHTSVVEVIVNDARWHTVDVTEAFKSAAYFGETCFMAVLLAHNQHTAAQMRWGILLAASNGQLPVVELLLKNDHIYSHTDLECALVMARKAGHHSIVELLLKVS
jgi:Ankyrin repeats (3 copies)